MPKFRISCKAKEITNSQKATYGIGEIFANHVSDEVLKTKICKEFIQKYIRNS
jgi:hypothetical protein